MAQENKFILWFDQIRMDDIPLVGGKNASLGEMYQELTVQGVKIPNGFATTSGAYWHLLEAAGILDKLKETLKGLDRKSNVKELAEKGKKARELMLGAKIPEDPWADKDRLRQFRRTIRMWPCTALRRQRICPQSPSQASSGPT